MSRNTIERNPGVTPFVLEGTLDLERAARFAAGEPNAEDLQRTGRRYLINSDQIVTIDDEDEKERALGVTRVFMTRGSTFYAPACIDSLKAIFEENGYRVYSLTDIAAKAKGPKNAL